MSSNNPANVLQDFEEADYAKARDILRKSDGTANARHLLDDLLSGKSAIIRHPRHLPDGVNSKVVYFTAESPKTFFESADEASSRHRFEQACVTVGQAISANGVEVDDTCIEEIVRNLAKAWGVSV